MRSLLATWQGWALLSAGFAALTAILAKVGVSTIDSNLATALRTAVVLVAALAVLAGTGGWRQAGEISGRGALFLVLSGLATAASWLCYFRALQLGEASRVAPIDKLSVVLVAVFGAAFLGERLTLPNWIGVLLIAAGAVLVAHRG